nr:hypothetical protein [Pseudoflavonifractor phocaeensis]
MKFIVTKPSGKNRCLGEQIAACRSSGHADAAPPVMPNDFAGANKVYIACGYTDLRGESMVRPISFNSGFTWINSPACCLASVAGTGLESKHCTGKGIGFFWCASAWSPTVSSSRAVKRKPEY